MVEQDLRLPQLDNSSRAGTQQELLADGDTADLTLGAEHERGGLEGSRARVGVDISS